MGGLSWPPSGPLPPGDALDAGHVDARRLLRPPPRATFYHPAGSYPHGLGPGRHAKQEHLAQRPDVIGQPRGHGRCPRLPLRGGARAIGRHRRSQRHTPARMRQAEIVVCVVERELLPHTVLALTERGDPTSHRGDMLAEAEVEAVTVDGGIAPSTSASKPCVPLSRHTAPQ